MKKKIGVIVLGIGLLFGCGSVTSETEASLPEEFQLISKSDDGLMKFQHIETGCYYLYMDDYKAGGLTQMFIPNENNIATPYCD